MPYEAVTDWRQLMARPIGAFPLGMTEAAELIQSRASDLAHDVIRGMSFATFDSLIAYVASPEDDGTADIVEAYNRASARLAGFTGHNGQPYLADVAGPGEGQIWIVLTVPTDYIDALVLEREDFLGDAGQSAAPAAFTVFGTTIKQAWHP